MEEERKWEELNRELLVEIFRRVESESLLESIQFVEREREKIMEEERKWEGLNRDLLVEIFRRVESESLLESRQFVCKSWYQATLVPNCWETLVFRSDYFCSAKFIKTAVDRSHGTATHIKFEVETPLPYKALVYISEKCPALKTLHVCPYNNETYDCILTGDLICKWKNLEVLHISSVKNLEPILESISIHCKNFVEFRSSCFIDEQASAAIVQFMPKIKYLKLRSVLFLRECLIHILKGCKELELLDVSDCEGFDAHDTEILELASHIPSFKCKGSIYQDEWEY